MSGCPVMKGSLIGMEARRIGLPDVRWAHKEWGDVCDEAPQFKVEIRGAHEPKRDLCAIHTLAVVAKGSELEGTVIERIPAATREDQP